MSHCRSCGADIEGRWRVCPLCWVPLDLGAGVLPATEEAYPAAPLRFDRRQLWAVLVPLSVLAVIASFAAQALVPDLMAPIRTVWLSVAALWLVVLVAAYRRHNVGSLVLWLVVLLSLAAVAWDLVTGWSMWATTWAIPSICTFANLALVIVVRVVRMEPSEHIAKAALVMLFGLVPGLFVLLGWVTVTTPSWACVGLSALLLAAISVFRPRQLGDALHRRLQA